MALVNGTQSAYTSDTNKWLNTQRATGMVGILDNSASLPITSTNIEIYCNNQRVGFIQSFSPSESRTITPIQELGTEGVVQMAPGNTNGGQISINRIALFNGNLFNALGMTKTGHFATYSEQIPGNAVAQGGTGNTLGNPFKNLKEQRVPLEIQVKTKMPDMETKAYYVETYVDCWLSAYSKAISAGQITVAETATIVYSDVYSDYVTAKD